MGLLQNTFDFCNGGTMRPGSEFWMLSLQEKNRHARSINGIPKKSSSKRTALGMNSGYVTFAMEFPGFSAYANRKKAKQKLITAIPYLLT